MTGDADPGVDVLRPIGVIRSPFAEPVDAPLQSLLSGDIEARIVIDDAYIAGLQGLDGFDLARVITLLDRASVADLRPEPFLLRGTGRRGAGRRGGAALPRVRHAA